MTSELAVSAVPANPYLTARIWYQELGSSAQGKHLSVYP